MNADISTLTKAVNAYNIITLDYHTSNIQTCFVAVNAVTS